MSYYRDVYLKSDDWKNFRLAVLAKRKNKCAVCKVKSRHNDVHHMEYRKLWDVQVKEMKVLCRTCHKKVHDIMDKYPKLKTLPRIDRWQIIRKHLAKPRRIARAEKNQKRDAHPQKRFSALRKKLVEAGVVYRKRFVFSPALASDNAFLNALECPYKMLEEYERITGINARIVPSFTAGLFKALG